MDFFISLTIDLRTREARGRVTSLRSHRNILYVKIGTVYNVKLILLAISYFRIYFVFV